MAHHVAEYFDKMDLPDARATPNKDFLYALGLSYLKGYLEVQAENPEGIPRNELIEITNAITRFAIRMGREG